jgi:hypothetical protein
MIILFAISHRILSLESALSTRMAGILAAALASLAIAFFLTDRLVSDAFLIAALASFAIWSWFFLLAADERTLARRYLGTGLRAVSAGSARDGRG